MPRPRGVSVQWLLLGCVLATLPLSLGNHDAKRLYDDLMRKSGYNSLIRPVGNSTAKLTVKLCLKLSQLIDVVSRARGRGRDTRDWGLTTPGTGGAKGSGRQGLGQMCLVWVPQYWTNSWVPKALLHLRCV